MKESIVAAVSENNVIGKEGKIPWHLPEDLKRFKQITDGHCVIMGRKTFESIGKPLRNRTNIVVTSSKEYGAKGVVVADSLEKAFKTAEQLGEEEVMIAGGERIYEEALPGANRIYLTRVHERIDGDRVFPQLNMAQWKVVEREYHEKDENNPLSFSFLVLERKE